MFHKQRRVPHRPHPRPEDIFVTRSSSFDALVKRATSLLDAGRYVFVRYWNSTILAHVFLCDFRSEVVIHGLGAALTRAVELALALRSKGGYTLSIRTNTVELIDDLVPVEGVAAVSDLGAALAGEAPPVVCPTVTRCNSAIHIRVSRS
jgi:hypothetical protein